MLLENVFATQKKKKKKKKYCPEKMAPRVLDITPLLREKEITHPPGSTFFKKFPQEKGVGKKLCKL